ncbi:MAG: ribbon-helix-helix protein, CopG family [Gemmatimonadetes bacterium]|nr:ribbon-helix-helix protein, CopG family [Gemmatimonadota bacterium]MYC90040.1 ribbon-helix-helix protein, CopG family [Gemmatimonadota bacterium]MYG36402.1 ribbon-helix-helix protein, CopG family [Gemmatimonadota bacterium]
MRTTISLSDRLDRQVRREAATRGMSVSAFIARTLDDALKRPEGTTVPPFRLVTVRSRPRLDFDLDRTRVLEVEEDAVRFGHG